MSAVISANPPQMKTIRVVVIEDQRELREGLRVLLDFTPNFRCTKSFGSMEDALENLDGEAADLILTDIGLPRMNGIEGTRILREKFPTLPIIVLTIHGERKLDEKVDLKNYHRVERHYGEFMRNFTLPPFIDVEKITPEYKDGLLLISLPKLKEARPKHIEVKVK